MNFVPKIHMREEVAADLRTILHASDLSEAQGRLKSITAKYKDSAPNLADWLEANVPESLTVFALPEPQRKKRRTRVATLFPNEKSLERLVSALLAEVSDEWESGNAFLNMKN